MVKIIKKMFFTALMIVPCILVLCGCTNEVPVENAKISEVNISVPTILGNTYITRPGLYDATTRDLTYTVKTKW